VIVDNWYLGIPLIVTLILLDKVLTHVGYGSYLRHYKAHIESEHYELNPIWQKDVEERGKIFSRRYLVFVVILCAWLGLAYTFPLRPVVAVGTGLFCGIFLPVDLDHLNNLLYLRILSRIPNSIEGKVKFSYRASTISTAISKVQTGLLLSTLLLFTEPSAFAIAFAVAPFVTAIQMVFWARRAKKEVAGKRKKMPLWQRLVFAFAAGIITFIILVHFLVYPQRKYNDDFQKALQAYNSKDYLTALQAYEKLHQQRPEEPGALFNLALCHYNLGNLKQAKTLFEEFVKRHPKGSRSEEARSLIEQCSSRLEPNDEEELD